MSTELLVIDKLVPAVIFKEGGIQPILDRIKEEVVREVPDLTTQKGRDRIATNARNIATSKALLEKMGKELTDDLNAKKAPIMAERNLSKSFLDDLRDEIRKPLTDWEMEEEKRKSELAARVDSIVTAAQAYSDDTGEALNSSELKAKLANMQILVVDDSFGGRELEARKAKDTSIAALESHIAKAVKVEAEQVELERLRLAAEAQKKKDHDIEVARVATEKAAKIAADAAKVEADRVEKERLAAIERERLAKEATAKAKRDAATAIENAKIAQDLAEKNKKEAAALAEKNRKAAEVLAEKNKKEAAETARLNEVERQKKEKAAIAADAAKREANKANKKKIHNQTVKCLVAVNPAITTEIAREIVIAMATDKIDNVTLEY